jgi:hypothetical protein
MVQDNFYGSLFEDNYLTRGLGSIANQADVALTELVANSWDAGATEVKIIIPDKHGEKLIIEDNGIGLTSDEFQNRWMKLRYDRIKNQGKRVVFPKGVEGSRFAYGRNGVGRHGLLCFNDEYFVSTNKKGKNISCKITTKKDNEPFVAIEIIEKKISPETHGTYLEVLVQKNLPKVDRIKEIISARFLHDPKFKIEINGSVLPLDDLEGLLDKRIIEIEEYGITLSVWFIDSIKSAKKSRYQGIAFWQSGRLVGEPSWILGKEVVLDGRTSIAKRYTAIISTEDLSEQVKEDWSGFNNNEIMDKVYSKVSDYIDENINVISKSTVEDTKQLIREQFSAKLKKASPLVLYEIDEIIESIHINSPKAKQESVSIAVDAIINLEQSKSGKELLEKLSKLEESDIDGLNQMLAKWTIKDALIVLNEIDRRITIIEAIRKLSQDKEVDELHILHPLITESRWLFGPEYDSAEYTSNRQLQTVIKTLFKNKAIQRNDINYHKRPDIVCIENSTLSLTGTDDFSEESALSTIGKILIIELKRGGFKIAKEERNQAQDYTENLISSFPNAKIFAYVVGDTIGDTVQHISKVGRHDEGKIFLSTFTQLVDTAEKRLFGLRNKLSLMYDDVPGVELLNQIEATF